MWCAGMIRMQQSIQGGDQIIPTSVHCGLEVVLHHITDGSCGHLPRHCYLSLLEFSFRAPLVDTTALPSPRTVCSVSATGTIWLFNENIGIYLIY